MSPALAYRIVCTPVAEKAFDKLPQNIKRRIQPAIDALANNPRPPGVVKLKGQPQSFYRIRVGVHRVIYAIRDQELLVLEIAHRRDVYRGL